MQSQEIFVDFEGLDPEQVEKFPLSDFERLNLKSAMTLYNLYPDVYHRLQAESEAKRTQLVNERNRSLGTIRKPQPKAQPPKPKVDRTKMSYNQWQEHENRQRGIEPYHVPSYWEWVEARTNPTSENRGNL